MRFKATLLDGAAAEDITVTCDATATAADLARVLRRGTSGEDAAQLTLSVRPHAGGAWRPLPAERPIAECEFASGDVMRVVSPTPWGDATGDDRIVGTLVVRSGPDSGRAFPVRALGESIGRDPACSIVLTDPMVSKRHARLIAGPTRIQLVDSGSANGIRVDGALVSRLEVPFHRPIWLGDSELVVEPPDDSGAGGTAASRGVRGGARPVSRPPRLQPRYGGTEHELPALPTERDRPRFPWMSLGAPVVMGLVMFAITGRALSLLFIALSPLMMVGGYIDNRAQRRKHLRDQVDAFERAMAALDAQLSVSRDEERRVREHESPSAAALVAHGHGGQLWTRRPEHWSFRLLRLATGTVPSRDTFSRASQREVVLPGFAERVDAFVQRLEHLDDVPIVEDPFDAGAIGVVGPIGDTASVLRAYIAQLVALHSPAELIVTAAVGPDSHGEFGWLTWLPHTSSPQSPLEGVHLADSPTACARLVASLEELVEIRTARAQGIRRGATTGAESAMQLGASVGEAEVQAVNHPVVVLLVTADAPVDRARVIQLAERAADCGVFPLWSAERADDLPGVCRTWVELRDSAGSADVHFVRESVTRTGEADRLGRDDADAFAHGLAPLVDDGAAMSDATDLPASVALLDVLGGELADSPAAAVERWRQNQSMRDRSATPARRRRSGLRAIVGVSGADPLHLDLRAQGPHALVGGTTGAGKSEFLQAWVLAAAAEYSPDRLTFLFVDYKGGSAFAECVALPHCVGLVTDLSPYLVRRALTSLRAELLHREHLLGIKKAKDLLELEERADPDCPPALIIMIDEFAALIGDVPEFVDGVVDIAQRGRSLGIHLVMATQRPAGVIRDNLRANTNLRVALRMADEHDSVDVVDHPEAAHFDPSMPGRGIAKTGPGRLTRFQSAYVGGWSSAGPAPAHVEIASLRFGLETAWRAVETPESTPAVADPGPNDQARLVANLRAAAAAAAIEPPRRPWLEELAAAYDLADLGQRTDEQLAIGIADIPDRQLQEVVHFVPDRDGHLAVFGTGGSGKTVLLRTLAVAAGIVPEGGPVHVYGLDFGGGGLRMLQELPHVGDVVSGSEGERVVRLLRTLRDELDTRSRAFSEVHVTTVGEYRRVAARPTPRLLLLVDGFPAFRDEYEAPLGRSSWYDVFLRILTEGRQAGIHVALTADRGSAVPSAVASAIPRRVVLRLADDAGYSSLGVPDDVLTAASPPGRALVDGHETQIAVLGGTPHATAQAESVYRLAATAVAAGVVAAPPVGSLPADYPVDELPATVRNRPVLGISDDDLAPIDFEPQGAFLVAGGPGAGRTTALGALAVALERWGSPVELHLVCGRRSVLPEAVAWSTVSTTVDEWTQHARRLAERMRDDGERARLVLVVEQLADLMSTPVEAPLLEAIRAARRGEHFVIAESETTTWGSSWPLLAEVKAARRGLVLQPDTTDGDLILRTTFPRLARSEFPPGRGMAVLGGAPVRVQLPHWRPATSSDRG